MERADAEPPATAGAADDAIAEAVGPSGFHPSRPPAGSDARAGACCRCICACGAGVMTTGRVGAADAFTAAAESGVAIIGVGAAAAASRATVPDSAVGAPAPPARCFKTVQSNV